MAKREKEIRERMWHISGLRERRRERRRERERCTCLTCGENKTKQWKHRETYGNRERVSKSLRRERERNLIAIKNGSLGRNIKRLALRLHCV